MEITYLTEKAVELIRELDHVSISEILHMLDREGIESGGPVSLYWANFENLCLMAGMSEIAYDVICAVCNRPEVNVVASDPLIYYIDGKPIPNLPIAKRVRAYKKPRWLPVVFRPVAGR